MTHSISPETLDSEMDHCSFPEEVITEILLRIPSKDLIKLKIVCKPWNFLISKPEFVKSHCARSRVQRQELFIPYHDPSQGHLSVKLPCFSTQTENIIFPSLRRRLRSNVLFRASCNGLLLLGYPTSVCNPATGQLQFLPDPIVNQSDLTLVHDVSTDKYKVFALTNPACLMVCTLGGDETKEDWRTVGYVGYVESPYLCIGNELHWESSSRRYEDGILVSEKNYVYSVDIGKETIRKIEIPTKEAIVGKNKGYYLSEIKGSLCLITVLEDSLEICLLANESWITSYMYRIPSSSNVPNFLEKIANYGRDICIVSMPCGELSELTEAVKIFIHVGDHIFLYDFKKHDLEPIGNINEYLHISRLYVVYFDSLVRW